MFFRKMPAVLIELSFSFLDIFELLKASRSCKMLKERAEKVLAQVTDMNSKFSPHPRFFFLMGDIPLFSLLMRMPSLERLPLDADDHHLLRTSPLFRFNYSRLDLFLLQKRLPHFVC